MTPSCTDDEVVMISSRRVGNPFPATVQSGREYHISRIGTPVDIQDAEELEKLEATVWCFRQSRWISIRPLAIANY